MIFETNPGASTEALSTLSAASRELLPAEYFEFIAESNGGEGFLGEEYAMIWKAEELDELNSLYDVSSYLPGVILIGSDGAGEAYGFRWTDSDVDFVRVPFIGMDISLCESIGCSFSVFVRRRGE